MRNTALLISCVVMVLGACEPGDPLEGGSVSEGYAPVCQVTVQGGTAPDSWGAKDAESDYLPRVLWCETGHLPPHPELLLAQAIVARTWLHQRMREGGSVANGEGDKIYSASWCSGAVPAAYRQAVAQTAGRLLARPGSGALHAGISHAGNSNQCQKSATCSGEPCIGLKEASTCATGGYDHEMILRLFFDDAVVVTTRGQCPGNSGGAGASCSSNGQQGTCQAAGAACDGVALGGLCAGDALCCLPPYPQSPSTPGTTTPPPSTPTKTYGACSYKGYAGTCQNQSAPCAGVYYTNVCNNAPAGVMCCLPKEVSTAPDPGTAPETSNAEAVYFGRSCDGGRGSCQSRTNYSCPTGDWKAGVCPGSADVQCCRNPMPAASNPDAPYYGSSCSSGQGSCQSKQTYSCTSATWKSGICAGSADVQCCMNEAPAPPPAPETTPSSADYLYYGKLCTVGGQAGKCQSHANYSCTGGAWTTGVCPGSADVQCCVVPPTSSTPSYGTCNYNGMVGKCLDKGTDSCAGDRWQAGVCPGSTNVQCCLPEVVDI